MSLQDAGEYTVSWVDNNDEIVYQGKATIEVIPVPNPPCTITANSSTSTGPFGSYNFSSRSFSVMTAGYTVKGSAGSDNMQFLFWGTGKPKPGAYDIDPKYYVDKYGTVGLAINIGSSYTLSALGGKVYVTAGSNGKLSVSFCSVNFNNPINSASLVISGNITEP